MYPSIFKKLVPPPDNAFYSGNDPHDIKLGDIVLRSAADYEHSLHVVLGSPQDEGVKRNEGRDGARFAPNEIRTQFYKLSSNDKIKSANVFDAGDIKTNRRLEDIHTEQEEIIYQLLNDGKKIIIIGGGNDISYPDCKALSRFNNNLLALNIDSHFDVRFDQPRNSGTPYRMLLEEGLLKGENFFEIGYKNFNSSQFYEKYLLDQRASLYSINKVKDIGIDNLLGGILAESKCESVFWGFDMDVVRGMEAPGVSAPNPNGLTAEEAIHTAEIAGSDKRTKIFEISEVNPEFDIDGRTSKLAAIMIWSFLNCSAKDIEN